MGKSLISESIFSVNKKSLVCSSEYLYLSNNYRNSFSICPKKKKGAKFSLKIICDEKNEIGILVMNDCQYIMSCHI